MSAIVPEPNYGSFLRMPRQVFRFLAERGDHTSVMVLLALIHRAAWEAGERQTRTHGSALVTTTLGIGECVIGRREIAESIGATEQSVRSALQRLAGFGFITVNSTKLGTRVTLVGFTGIEAVDPSGQPSGPPSGQPSGQPSGPPSGQPLSRSPRSVDTTTPARGARERGGALSPLPPDWEPDQSAENTAAEDQTVARGISVDAELAAFKERARALGDQRADWNAAWRLWLLRAKPDLPDRRDGLAYALSIANGGGTRNADLMEWRMERVAEAEAAEAEEARRGFSEAFEKAHGGSRPTWSKATEAALTGLLDAGHSPDEIVKRARIMFARPADAFPQSRDMATLARHFDVFVSGPNDQARGFKLLGEKPKRDEDDAPDLSMCLIAEPLSEDLQPATPEDFQRALAALEPEPANDNADRVEPGDAAAAYEEAMRLARGES